MAKKQEFLAAESFLFWNADDVKPIRDRLMMALSVPFQLLAAHREPLEASAPGWGHRDASTLCMLGSSLAAFLFLAQAMTSDISLGLKFRLSLVGSLTRERQAHRAGWALADFHSVEPTTKRVGHRVSAHYRACVCGLGYGCYVRRLTASLVIIGFSQKPRWLFKSLG